MLSEIISFSTGGTWVVSKYNPVPGVLPEAPANKDYNEGYWISLMNKDMGLAIDAGEKSGANLDATKHIKKQYFEKLIEKGYGGKDLGFTY
mmetsp:Transcript_48014/g.35217  ORF Transcript_48014/g.35217 Transcript_48014/m.35217 type:complete len:91 (+) Transcript_48014:654-926(+)|eukprot:CAMPEP_0202956904 /NCGR_PEP_ID=MMETSP1396-20130829/1373_1 /ASSEMBLY_ACC=CAM_ASM_000872 /TAXON_ID= /ORGANISM="Pseudokeronopsis sp., Strain Brazil" /LENGTH=90 /DNA_ID=CAMNT_0049674131 /DNA_START=638 /DNA_END=910 /DNA_ORIENTATION=-